MRDYIFGSAFEVWKSELDAINREASLLLAAARQASIEDRRALQSQCAALIERRNTAVHNLLHSAFPRRHSIATEKPEELTSQGTRSADARAAANSFSPPARANSVSEEYRTLKTDTEIDMPATRRLDQLREAQNETVELNPGDWWVGDKQTEDDCQGLLSQSIDINFAPPARRLGVLSDVKFEEVVATARDTIARASRAVMRTIKGGREGEAPEVAREKRVISNDSCSSDGPSLEPPQDSVSTTDAAAVDRALDAPIEAMSKPRLNSALDNELIRILSGEEADHDLDAVIRVLSRESSNSGHPETGPVSGQTSNFDVAALALQAVPISARFSPLCRVQFRPRSPTSSHWP
jgi:hypothetical protein